MADELKPGTPIPDAELHGMEVASHALAQEMMHRYQQVPDHIMMSAMEICMAVIIVGHTANISMYEQEMKILLTDENRYANIVEGVKLRVEMLRDAKRIVDALTATKESRAN